MLKKSFMWSMALAAAMGGRGPAEEGDADLALKGEEMKPHTEWSSKDEWVSRENKPELLNYFPELTEDVGNLDLEKLKVISSRTKLTEEVITGILKKMIAGGLAWPHADRLQVAINLFCNNDGIKGCGGYARSLYRTIFKMYAVRWGEFENLYNRIVENGSLSKYAYILDEHDANKAFILSLYSGGYKYGPV